METMQIIAIMFISSTALLFDLILVRAICDYYEPSFLDIIIYSLLLGIVNSIAAILIHLTLTYGVTG